VPKYLVLNQNSITMDDKSKHIKLHVGSMITLRALERHLDDAKIPSLIKNFSNVSKTTGFGDLYNDNEIFVLDKDIDTAKNILKKFLEV